MYQETAKGFSILMKAGSGSASYVDEKKSQIPDRIGMRSRKPCIARPQKGWRHAVSKFKRAVNMKIVIEKR